MTDKIERQLWERLPHETPKQYHAFCHYRDLPPSRRSIFEAWLEHKRICEGKALSREEASRWSISRWAKWASMNDWAGRAAAWDEEVDRRKRLAYLEAIEQMSQRHAKLAMRLQEIALKRLESLSPGAMRAQDIQKLLEMAIRIEREAMGEKRDSPIAQFLRDVTSMEIRMAKELPDDVLERIVLQHIDRIDDEKNK